ncbi:hypothetical protein Q1695_005564 [Nippostrongylus brasiliensis]|nr:hypothetical protein Q1695_005564 [Nippostrongylus brasiliensis]
MIVRIRNMSCFQLANHVHMIVAESLFLTVLLFRDVIAAPKAVEPLRCIFSRASNLDDWTRISAEIAKGAKNVSTGLDPVAALSAECVDPQADCVAIWTARENQTEVLLQGCWDFTQGKCSDSDVCASGDRVFQQLRNGFPSYMCCCRSNHCNQIDRLIVGPLTSGASIDRAASSSPRGATERRDTHLTILLWTSSVVSVLVLVLTVRKCWHQYQFKGSKHRKGNDISGCPSTPTERTELSSKESMQKSSLSSELEPLVDIGKDPVLASLHLGERIGGGHFAVVHRATSSMGDVAVKVYHSDEQTFQNELEILNLLQPMGHPNIIHLISAVVTSNRLVLQLYSGSLHSVLEERSLNMTEFFDCALAINDGLAFLHSHTNGSVSKPVVAHRDLNPNNILVHHKHGPRVQLCISDFGLSVAFPEGRPTKSLELITERGTVRYMAGELIEGSVNLLDPMTSLLQTDVYSCALVMWELLWRCRDIWPEGEIPSHRVAFDNLVPRSPHLEHMYTVVVRERRRPDAPPPISKQQALSKPTDLLQLWSFIAEMWEHEPEGRTTAACMADRLRRLRKTMDPFGFDSDSY